MADQTFDDVNVGEDIGHIVRAVSGICNGHNSAVACFALAMVIGKIEAQNENSDLPKLMRMIEDVAQKTRDQERFSIIGHA